MSSETHTYVAERLVETSSSNSESNLVENKPNHLAYYISPTFVKIDQIKKDLSSCHQHEMHEMTELNGRFRSMLEHLHQLEVQNSKYVTKLAELQRKSFLTVVNGKHSADLSHFQADVVDATYEKINCESEIELLQLQSQMYQQAAQLGEVSFKQQRSNLEIELNQSNSTLVELRRSYESMEQTVGSLRATIKEKMKQYIVLSKEWSTLRKQTKELRFSIQMVNVQVQFTKSLYANYNIFSLDMEDFGQFWKSEWEQILKRIRNDFQLVYAAVHQETVSYYEKKSKEIAVDLEKLVESHRTEQLEYAAVVEQLQLECEHTSKVHSNELRTLQKTEGTVSELESEFKAMQIHYNKTFEAQSTELQYLHDTFVTMAAGLEEAQRRKICLENEIIIYRHILGKSEIKKTIETSVKKTRTYNEKNQYIGSVYIECPLESTHISIYNQSTGAAMNVSSWRLVRRVDSKTTLQYRIPNGTEIRPGGQLRVFSKLGTEVMQLYSNEYEHSSRFHQELVVNDAYSMGIGETIETSLFNEYGQEVATCIQTAESDWTEYE